MQLPSIAGTFFPRAPSSRHPPTVAMDQARERSSLTTGVNVATRRRRCASCWVLPFESLVHLRLIRHVGLHCRLLRAHLVQLLLQFLLFPCIAVLRVQGKSVEGK